MKPGLLDKSASGLGEMYGPPETPGARNHRDFHSRRGNPPSPEYSFSNPRSRSGYVSAIKKKFQPAEMTENNPGRYLGAQPFRRKWRQYPRKTVSDFRENIRETNREAVRVSYNL